VRASLLQFSPTAIVATAGATFTITMNNTDILVPHDIVFPGYGRTDNCPGPCTSSMTFVAPPRGVYKLTCTLHPDMTVTLTTR
jgi:plastocyanin